MSSGFIKGDPNKNLIPVFAPPGGSGRATDVLAGDGIAVVDLTDVETYRFEVSALEYISLTAALTLVAKISGVNQTSPILKGRVVDRVELSWTYNKAIAAQTLTNNGGLVAPTLIPADAAYTYLGQNITSNISFTITGNDGAAKSGSIAADTKSVSFGNLMWLGKGPTKLNTSASALETFIESLSTSVIKTSRAHTYFATGGVNEKHFVAYPKAYGLATFKKGIFEGGYVRLKNVAGNLVFDAGVNPETDIIITNSAGFAEAYYVYESLYDNQNDPVTSFVIS